MQAGVEPQPLFAIIGILSARIMKNTAHAKRRSQPQISWEQILANLDDGVIVVDAAGKVIFFNEA